jgi:protein TonB
MVDWDAPTPDTVRFDMQRCPPPGVDLSVVFDSSAVTDQPLRVWSPPAQYPDALRSAGIQGRVVLEFVIDTLGRVDTASVRVLTTSHPEFALAARQVVYGTRYWPARLGGRKVRMQARVPINFTISRSSP